MQPRRHKCALLLLMARCMPNCCLLCSCKRRSHKRRPYDSSPHLELRLQLLNSSDDEDGRQEQKQDPASPEEVLGDPDAGDAVA